jgi:predicted PurR-regulated permease PerM
LFVESNGTASGQLKTAFFFAMAAATLVLLYWLQTVLLLGFVAVLLGIMLDALAVRLVRYSKLPRGVCVVLAALVFILAVLGGASLIAVPLMREGTHLMQSIPEKASILTRHAERYRQEFPWLKHFVPSMDTQSAPESQSAPKELAKKTLFTISAITEWSATALATFFLGLFLAWNPERWLRGVAGLWPDQAGDRYVALLRKIASALRSYLFALGIYMVAMASLWALGLWLIGMDYALLFGLIGGVVEIVPYLGPLIGFIPPLLFGLTLGPMKVLYLVLLYIVLHIVEGYILVPYLMHEREHLPPPLVVFAILAFGALFGVLGVVVAVPLGMAGYVLLNEIVYKRHTAGQRPSV